MTCVSHKQILEHFRNSFPAKIESQFLEIHAAGVAIVKS